MRARIGTILLGTVLALGVQAAYAQDKKITKAGAAAPQQPAPVNVAMCVGCHGIPGYKTAYPEVYHVPRIAGQQPAYLVSALQAYKTGQRSHPSMRGIAASLSDEEMAALAAYYAGTQK